jgi:hypothetical protein
MSTISNRVLSLEQQTQKFHIRLEAMENAVSSISNNTIDILDAIKTAKIAGGWLGRIGRHALTAALTAGVFSGKLAAFLSAFFA